MAWPDNLQNPPLRQMLDEIVAFAMQPSPDPRWMDVLANAILCRDDDDHGAHATTADPVKQGHVAKVWGEIRSKGPNADVAFCLSEMNHGGAGL